MGWLPVDEVLQSRGIILASKCQCCQARETINRAILYNTEVNKVWSWYSSLFQVPLYQHSSVMERFKSWVNSSDDIGVNHIRILIPILIDWFSWLARNDAKHKRRRIQSYSIICKIMNIIHLAQIAKPFSRDFWRGNVTIVASWQVRVLPPKVGRVQAVYWIKPPPNWVKINTDCSFCSISKELL